MNKKVLAIVGGGCLLLLLCAVCLVGIYYFGGSQINQLAAQFGIPSPLGGAGISPEGPTTGGPTALPAQTRAGSTSAAPTRAAAPSTSGGNPLTDWLIKAKTAQKYRCEVTWLFGSTKNGKYVEEPFLDMSGVVDGANEQFTMKTGIFTAFTGGAALETIEVDGKSYWKGVTLFPGTDPKQWYLQKDSSSASGFTDFCKPDQWNSFTGGSADFKKVRTEQLDGQSCDVYFYDLKSVQNSAILGMFGSAQNQGAFSAVDKGEINVLACADGFVHKYTLEYAGHDQKNPNDKAGMKMNWHAYDFNNATIKITAPQGAKPMPGQ